MRLGLTCDRYSLVLVALLACGFFVLLRPSVRGNDGVQNYVHLRSLMFDGDLDFANEYEYYFARDASWFDHKPIPRDPETGKPINLYGIGNSLLWAPWVIVAHLIGLGVQWGGLDVSLDGYSRIYEWGVGAGSCFYASVGLLLLYWLLRAAWTSSAAFWATMATWLATPLFFYMYFHPSMSHANSFFLSVLLVLLYRASAMTCRFWAAMGAVGGMLVLTRFQDAVLLTAVGVGEILTLREELSKARADNLPSKVRMVLGFLKHRFPYYGCFLLSAGVVLSPQLACWKVLQGHAFSGPRAYLMQGSFNLFFPRHFVDVLFSSFHGLFFWHPVLLLGLFGFFDSRVALRWRLPALAAFLTQAWLIGSWSHWWAGASFGHRMFISTLPFLAIGLVAAFEWGRPPRRWVPGIVLAFSLWNFGYIVQYATGIIPRQSPVALRVLIRNNLTQVPEILLTRRLPNQR